MADPGILIFLTSGLFLGWSLGANDAANVFGTAVGSRMVRFTTAALICGIFVILGATISGTGAALTLGKLGAVNALGGSFMAALSAGLTVYWMTRLGLPVSTSQAIIGSIVGWNLFSDSYTDLASLLKILSTWVICPLLAAIIAAIIYILTKIFVRRIGIGLIRLDGYTRLALILAGAFGAYSLGANNIANVMGVFVPVAPFQEMRLSDNFSFSSTQQLFLIGGLAIAIGVFTYSKRVMLTVGSELMRLTPLAAWVAVMAHSIVLFLFASEKLEQFLASLSLPTIPLVPVSSSQAVVGAVIGIGMLQGGREIRWGKVTNIVKGWIITPLVSGMICLLGLYFLQNVFMQTVQRESLYILSSKVMQKLKDEGIDMKHLHGLQNTTYPSSASLIRAIESQKPLPSKLALKAIKYSLLNPVTISSEKLELIDTKVFSTKQMKALKQLNGKKYDHSWQLGSALETISHEWEILGGNIEHKLHDRAIKQKLAYIYRHFSVKK
ncbi:MAG: anion permease [SAR324 cluster bacterium]|nr:anion permease [SAR324 cluster bacterium]